MIFFGYICLFFSKAILKKSSFSYYRIRIIEGSELLTDTGYLIDKTYKGGKLGVLVFSQKEIVFSALQYRCTGKYPSLHNILVIKKESFFSCEFHSWGITWKNSFDSVFDIYTILEYGYYSFMVRLGKTSHPWSAFIQHLCQYKEVKL